MLRSVDRLGLRYTEVFRDYFLLFSYFNIIVQLELPTRVAHSSKIYYGKMLVRNQKAQKLPNTLLTAVTVTVLLQEDHYFLLFPQTLELLISYICCILPEFSFLQIHTMFIYVGRQRVTDDAINSPPTLLPISGFSKLTSLRAGFPVI